MRSFWILIIFLIFFTDVRAEKVYASDFGFMEGDATHAFQTAVRSVADTVIIDLQASEWIVGPSDFRSLRNKTIIFEPGVILSAKPGAFPKKGDCLINLILAKNVRIIGYGATLQMQKSEYEALKDGEWRHCLAINNSLDVEVYGLTIKDSGGDGLYISSGSWYGSQLYSENILLQDIWCDNNYRQGISIITVQHLLVRNCWFTNTKGTLPMSGVDLEPDSKSDRAVDVVFEKCRFTGNSGNGIQLSFGNLDSSCTPVDITFRDCYVADNHDIDHPYAAAEIQAGGSVSGKVLFERCMVENSQWTAVFIRKPANSYFMEFEDCVFKDVSQNTTASKYNSPFWFEVTDYFNPCPRYGGASFTNCLLEYNSNYDFLNTYGEINTSPGLGNVQLNNLTIIHPNASVTYKTSNGGGSPSTDCVFDFQRFSASPSTILDFASEEYLIECSALNSIIEATRTSENISFPIGVTYELTGTGQQGSDLDLMNGFMIIPADTISQKDTLKVLKDEVEEKVKNIVIQVISSSLFGGGSVPQSISVLDCETSGPDELRGGQFFSVFPNPASDIVQINLSFNFDGFIELLSITGKVVLSQAGHGRVIRINTGEIPPGNYIVHLRENNKHYNQRIIKL